MATLQQEPIAIIGAGCRFPGGSTRPSRLWELLEAPYNVASKIPKERFSLDAFYHPMGTRHGTTNVTESYFLSDGHIRHFDSGFFNTPPSEADPMDPQHRHLLEVVYETLEDSGMTIEELQGSNTSVFVGLMCTDYNAISSRDLDSIPTYGVTGIATSNASSRISYFFDWHGACMTIDTACSSSLIALNQAVKDLRSGASNVAIVAGTNLLLDPLPYVSESNLNMLSPTGRSRMWDASADGYARGDGVAAIALKTLSQALRDGDFVDCIIRETGANQDGRTKGITMPNGLAQAALIRDTYARAQLDPMNSNDRCQYFEAHGTGTQAGDPQEALALDAAFFGTEARNDTLYVGSVKTVIGHTEGTAGLAGILKAIMALKHKIIPPNLHFTKLNSAVEPYYKHLEILTKPMPWPELPPGVPRRASVNSFGFGGSNAHVILESYDSKAPSQPISLSLLPFVFSANSENSLQVLLQSYATYLADNPAVDLDSLRYTLTNKRSALTHKTSFVATTASDLCSQIQERLHACKQTNETIGIRPQGAPEILAIFTGQGAQWAAMGKGFIEMFPPARRIIAQLDNSLASLPKADRPDWSILAELTAAANVSRIGEAAISQPLCTALQIVLVDLLRNAGIEFKAVVGHSSGEIAAAFAAGLISASDAIRIAYYRGLHVQQATGPGGRKGAMMAVGTSLVDAQEFCKLKDIEGRISVAASNSSSSVTISGDMDAVEEAKAIFDREKKFTRLLKVDTAYHSHHMLPCAAPYEESLRACHVQILTPGENAPIWVSSVREGKQMTPADDLDARYWVDNMANTVLFSHALEYSLKILGSFNFALEVGPHPALKGPASQTIQETGEKEIPYFGTLDRGLDNVAAIAGALGAVWTALGSAGVNWRKFTETYRGDFVSIPMLKELPLYPWDHSRLFWSESRYGKLLRTQPCRVHPLLGQRIADGTSESIVRWKNILKIKEVTWLSGHALQGQIVFPGTGYIALAMEAAMEIAADRSVQSIELYDLAITKAIAIDESTGTEIVVSMTGITGHQDEKSSVIEARFTSFSVIGRESSELATNASGNVRINLGEPTGDVLMPREIREAETTSVDIDEFYATLSELGYGYSGPFKGLSTLRRRLGYAMGIINSPPHEKGERALLFHPGVLDTALQTLFAAFSAPGDAGLRELHAPSGIRRVTLVPSLCGKDMPEQVAFDSIITAVLPNHITGDIDLMGSDGTQKCIEIDGLGLVPLTAATEANDRMLFSKATWGLYQADGVLALERPCAAVEKEESRKAMERERAAFFYLRNLNAGVNQEQRETGIEDHHKALLEFATHMEDLIHEGMHPYAKNEWLSDTCEDIITLIEGYGHDAYYNLLRAVGDNMPAVLRGDITILEVMTKDRMLDDYYENTQGFRRLNSAIAKIMGQIAHRYPHTNILEIGAGTGGATKGILQTLKTAFTSYTYTDISTGFLEKARETFKPYSSRMSFNALDITKDPAGQGYAGQSWDIVVASNVLHATPSLEETMKNTRSLLKPGGFLVMLEIVHIDTMAVGLTMGGLPGWWVGRNDGRQFSPTITMPQWDAIMRRVGFSGIETHTPDVDPLFIASVFVSQAVNEEVTLLRNPLSSRPDQIAFKDLVVIGGASKKTTEAVACLHNLLRPRCENLTVVSTLEELEHHEVVPTSTILSLTDLDSPVLKDLTEKRWSTLRELLPRAGNILWVTSGYRAGEPYAGAIVGLHRCTAAEMKQLRIQLLELDILDSSSVAVIAELLLRLRLQAHRHTPLQVSEILWSFESDLMIEKGTLKILRVMPDTEANNRYNSAKRLITKDVDPRSSTIQLKWINTTSNYSIHEVKAQQALSSCLSVHVSHSLLPSIRTAGGLAYVGLGAEVNTGRRVLFLSKDNASLVTMRSACVTSIELEVCDEPRFLKLVAAYLYSRQILSRLHPRGTLLVHEPDPLLAHVIEVQLKDSASHVYFTTCSGGKGRPNWIHLHSRMARRHLTHTLPTEVSLFFNLSRTRGDLSSRIADALPGRCERANESSLMSKEALFVGDDRDGNISALLGDINKYVAEEASAMIQDLDTDVQSLKEIVNTSTPSGSYTVIDWHRDVVVPAVLEPVDRCPNLFQDDRTYWMIGLAGDLGQSICDWMIDHGARYIILTSRSPKVPQNWVRACAAKSAIVEFIAGDITGMTSVRAMHDEIKKRFPPIAGVANGALVLRDKLFTNTTLEDFEAVMKPKVTGTLNLDQLFPENTLDWFIAFSSIVATTGNTGQCAYSAANMFMKAVINDRRQRGLAGATIDISRVHGVGYVERSAKSSDLTKKDLNKLHRMAMPMSESDLHQLFAEAVLASNPNDTRGSNVITGIRTLTSHEAADLFWAASPRLSHFIHEADTARSVEKTGKTARVPVKTQLESAKTPEEMVTIIKASLISKLVSSLEHGEGDTLSDTTPLIDFGMDSLVAVEIRSWFGQELDVDMPVLKITGGATISDLVDDAIEKLPRTLCLISMSGGRPDHTALAVEGSTNANGSVNINGIAHVNGSAHAIEAVPINGGVHANGNVSMNDSVHVNGGAPINGTVHLNGYGVV